MSLLVQLKHRDVGTFTQEFATNISPGGMFIRSRQPQPIGTSMKFEVLIAGGVRVMRGTAVVRWIRRVGDPAGAPGMGVQFLDIDESTRSIVEQMLRRKESAEEPQAPVAPEIHPEARALEAELRSRYGEPPRGKALSLPSIAPVAPVVAPLVPAIAPVIPLVAPAIPAAAAVVPPIAPVAPAVVPITSVAPPPVKALASPSAPVSSGGRRLSLSEALDLSSFEDEPLFDPFVPPPTPHTDVDLPLSELIANTLPPSLAPEKRGIVAPPRIDFELEAPVITPLESELVLPGTEVPREPPHVAPVVPLKAPPPAVEASEPELDFEISEPSRPPFGPAQPSRAPAPPPAPTPLTPTPQQVTPRPPAPRPDGATPLVFLTPPARIEGVGPVIGIDLGTTNSCVAILSNNKPTVLRSKDGYNTIPSVISLSTKGQLLVSHRAKSQLLLNPTKTIHGAKRLVGRPYDSPTVREVRERFHYEICPDATGRAAVRINQHILSLEEVQGLILRECKEMAEQHLSKKVERAVITVPAYYSEPQREAVRKASALAGLKVERIINEPTAAALAYGLNRELSKKVLVYDLGGGTFDATVLRIEKNVFEVLATGGDTFLGGVDFDNLIVDFLLQKFQQQEKISFSGDSVALSRVADAAERAKVALSERTSTEVDIPMLMMDDEGLPRSLRVTMTRADLNDVCGNLVARSLDVVRDVLLDARLKVGDIDDIILVGGQSRMLLVREKLKELFGRPPQASVNADEAVALGAALYSGVVDKVSSVVLVDVLPMTIGVGLQGGAFRRVIERNSPLPAQCSFALTTARDNEQMLEISIFQGEDAHVAGNEYLGTIRVEDLPRGPKGTVKVAITIKLDSECVIHVEARELSTQKEVKATIATRYSPEELQQQLKYGKEAVKAAEEKKSLDLRERGGRFWGFLKKVIGKA